MRKIRVLVVDDAIVFRRLVSDVLSSDPALEVVATAPNGRIALAKIPQVNPDLVILDVEMPEMNGLEALAEIRKTYPRLPVIMFSSLTERGAKTTLDALSLGATDYFTKPANVGSLDAALEVLRTQLVPEIKVICAKAVAAQPLAAAGVATPARPAVKPLLSRRSKVDIVAIGTSTGGPNALADVIPEIPANFPVPIVIVQHMPPMFTKMLADRLAAKSHIRVEEGRSGAVLEPGTAWIAPGDYHMVVAQDGTTVRLLTHRDPPENSCRPAVDVLFRSVAASYGSGTLAVVLTGMGQDGLRGCEHIREAGGQIVVQDEASSVVWGMPGFVAKASLADKVLPLDQVAEEIVRRTQMGRAMFHTSWEINGKSSSSSGVTSQ